MRDELLAARLVQTLEHYTMALYADPAATLDDLREAVTTLEELERTARRVLSGAHPVTKGIEYDLRKARAALPAPETQRFDKAARAGSSAKGLVHYLSRLQKARWSGNARKIAKFGRKVQKYSKLAAA